MSFEVEIIADSVSPAGKRLTTITATYPRFIHSEIMTHRDRARNAASSRAIPWPKMSEMISEHPVIPIKWGMEQSGMQTGDEIPEKFRALAEDIWLQAMRSAKAYADMIHNIGRTSEELWPGTLTEDEKKIKIHKSIPNRIVEPWMWITVVMTATEWKNFFRLRCHPDAEIHFQKIACMIRDALAESVPKELKPSEWHLPFILPEDYADHDIETLKKVSSARCARVSYLSHLGTRSMDLDIQLFDKLAAGSGFGHLSPLEHIATPVDSNVRSGPYVGWKQYRKEIPNECAEG